MEYYVQTICTKTYFFVQQHYLVTAMLSSMTHLRRLTIVLGLGSSRANHACQLRDF